MVRKISFIVPLSLLCALLFSPLHADAQFWKKDNSKKPKYIYKGPEHSSNNFPKSLPDSLYEPAVIETEPVRKLPQTTFKKRYQVDILLPLDINKFVVDGKRTASKLPAAIIPSINFYEGVKLAAEELNNTETRLDIYIHDIGEHAEKLDILFGNKTFNKSDLIIGALQSEAFSKIDSFTKEYKINFFSALSPSDSSVSTNPFFTILQPDLATHINSIIDFATKKYSRSPFIFLYGEKTPVQKDAKMMIENSLGSHNWVGSDLKSIMEDSSALLNLLSSEHTNVLFLNLFSPQDVKKALDHIKKISGDYKIAIFGMPTWKYVTGISDAKQYPDIDFYYSNPFYFDPKSSSGEMLVKNYKKNYGKWPSEMVFRGYETMLWASYLLNHYGNIFNENLNDSRIAPFTRFDVQEVDDADGHIQYYRNNNLFIFHYYNGLFNLSEH